MRIEPKERWLQQGAMWIELSIGYSVIPTRCLNMKVVIVTLVLGFPAMVKFLALAKPRLDTNFGPLFATKVHQFTLGESEISIFQIYRIAN
jgi:hypothetical protein